MEPSLNIVPPSPSEETLPLSYLETPPPLNDEKPTCNASTCPPFPNPPVFFSSPPQRSDVGQGIKSNESYQINELDSGSPSQFISDYDITFTNSGFTNFQPEWTGPAIPSRGGNGRTVDLPTFGSSFVNEDQISILSHQTTFLSHHGAQRSLQFGTNNSRLQGLSHHINNVGASLNSFVQPESLPNFFMNPPAANPVQMNWNSHERNLVQERNYNSTKGSDDSSILAVVREYLNNDHSESRAIVVASSAHVEQQIVPYAGSMSPPLDGNGAEEFNQGNPRTRQKASDTNKKGRRCHCEKTQCLKLYCDCFSAGYFCLASCTCKNCLNKRDYDDKVMVVREKIESHNPLAFAPKVTREGAESPANTMEDGTVSTPSSSRHRTGCNCKNSKCIKRYCVCFQVDVGCSFDCRCKDCKNSFGRRTGMYNTGQNGTSNMVQARSPNQNLVLVPLQLGADGVQQEALQAQRHPDDKILQPQTAPNTKTTGFSKKV